MKVKVKHEVIRELRVTRGWTQEKLAEVARVHARTIQRIENSGDASPQSVIALARALDVEPLILMNSEAKMTSVSQRRVESIAYEKRQYLQKLMQQTEKMQFWFYCEWVAWAVWFIGGILIVVTLMTTEANLNSTVILYVLFPGTAVGLLLLTIGGLGVHLIEKAREQENMVPKGTKYSRSG